MRLTSPIGSKRSLSLAAIAPQTESANFSKQAERAADYLTPALLRQQAEQSVASALGGVQEQASDPGRLFVTDSFSGTVLVREGDALDFTFQVIDRQNDASRQERARIALASQSGRVLDGSEGVEAKVVPNGVGSVFAASGLEEAPDGKTYQLWLIDAGKPVSAGTFEVEDGVGFLEVAQPVEDYDSAAVTIERAGGADAPTTDPVLSS